MGRQILIIFDRVGIRLRIRAADTDFRVVPHGVMAEHWAVATRLSMRNKPAAAKKEGFGRVGELRPLTPPSEGRQTDTKARRNR